MRDGGAGRQGEQEVIVSIRGGDARQGEAGLSRLNGFRRHQH